MTDGICQVVRMMMNRLVCLIAGHDPYKVRWKNVYTMNFNRKGRHKKTHGKVSWKVNHYRVYCSRCGKLLKKK